MRAAMQNEWMTVVVDEKGAELKSLRDGSGEERLWSGDPAFWGNQAPMLFPVVGGLHEDAYTLDGVRYEMAKHGFTRGRMFTLVEENSDQLVFELRESEDTLAQYPFAFVLRVKYRLEKARLDVVYEVQNLSDKPMPFQVGAHEAYACPEGVEAYEIVFEQEETLARYELAGSFLSRETTPWVKGERALALSPKDFEGDAIVFLDVKSKAVTLRSNAHERSLRVDFPGFDTLLLWTKPGAPFLCIEPWCGAPDFVDGSLELSQRHRIRMLQPGKVFACEHSITLEG